MAKKAAPAARRPAAEVHAMPVPARAAAARAGPFGRAARGRRRAASWRRTDGAQSTRGGLVTAVPSWRRTRAFATARGAAPAGQDAAEAAADRRGQRQQHRPAMINATDAVRGWCRRVGRRCRASGAAAASGGTASTGPALRVPRAPPSRVRRRAQGGAKRSTGSRASGAPVRRRAQTKAAASKAAAARKREAARTGRAAVRAGPPKAARPVRLRAELGRAPGRRQTASGGGRRAAGLRRWQH